MKKDNFFHFLALTEFLCRADQHYVEGRFMWFQQAWYGSCILLWLAVEQLMKTVIVQHRILNGTMHPISINHNSSTITVSHNPQEKEMSKILTILDRTFFKIDRRHDLDNLVDIMENEVGVNLASFKSPLAKVKEIYERRYFKNVGTSISLTVINEIDEFYFTFKSNLPPDIHRSLIDEIAYQKKFNNGHPLHYFQFAYLTNPHFKAKSHPGLFQSLRDGRIIFNDGDTDRLITNVPGGWPLHVAR